MKLEKVDVPPHFMYQCVECKLFFNTSQSKATADLDGNPFLDYYCEDCVEEIKRKSSSFTFWGYYRPGG